MGFKHALLPVNELLNVAVTVFAQLCGLKAKELMIATDVLSRNVEEFWKGQDTFLNFDVLCISSTRLVKVALQLKICEFLFLFQEERQTMKFHDRLCLSDSLRQVIKIKH